MATIGVVSSALSDHEHQVQLRRAVIASTIGTAIEWYDFFLYSVVTGLVFAKLFFPLVGPPCRHPRSVRYIRGGFHCTAHRCCDLWPLWRSDWAIVHAHCNIDDHGRCDFSGSTGPNLREHRYLERSNSHYPALHSRRRRWRRVGRFCLDVDGVGTLRQPPRLHRVLAAIRRALRSLSCQPRSPGIQPECRANSS